MTLPTLYLSHGAGPCFFIANPAGGLGTWDGLRASLEAIPATLPEKPRAVIVISAHWETTDFRVSASPWPPLVYDYYNYGPDAYAIQYPAPGDPDLARRVMNMLDEEGLTVGADSRGFDHGVFIPLKVMYPQADVPIVALSLNASLDPALHLRVGRALAPLREEGVLIIGSGSSYHGARRDLGTASVFDAWLNQTMVIRPDQRDAALIRWSEAPAARLAHPREEHLLPLMVVAGVAGRDVGRLAHRAIILGAPMSAFSFG